MSQEHTYGSLKKLYAAEHIFGYILEAYRNSMVYVTFSEEGNPVGKLRMTQRFT